MMIDLPQSVKRRLIEAAKEKGDWEICGFIMKDECLVFMPNVATEPHRFEMDPLALLDFYAEFPRPLGVFHSHPNGREQPSQSDIDYAPVGMRYWIITPTDVIEWDMDSGGDPKRISKPVVTPDATDGAPDGHRDPQTIGEGGASRCERCGAALPERQPSP